MEPRQRLAEAVRTIRPYHQGDLDGLCGLYSMLNAIQLVAYPRKLRRAEVVELFTIGLHHLEQRGTLPSLVAHGIHNAQWRRLAKLLTTQAARVTGENIVLVVPPASSLQSTEQALAVIKRHVQRGWPILLELHGRIHHWTVVVRVTEARLTLFDSSTHHWLPVSSIGLVRGRRRPLHGIYATGIVALRRGAERGTLRCCVRDVDSFYKPP